MRAITLGLAFTGLLVAAPAALAQGPAGGWVGEYRSGGKATPIALSPTEDGKNFTADLPREGVHGLKVEGASFASGHVRFDVSLASGATHFEGDSKGALVAGDITNKAGRGTFTLVHVEPVDRALNTQYAGSYELAPGRFVDLGPMGEMGGQLVFLDSKTLREGPLFALARDEFATGPTIGIPYPFAARVKFLRGPDGSVTSVRWTEAGGRPIVGKRVAPYTREEVAVTNGDVTLEGDLLVPSSPGPHPAVVFAHGSGPATRDVGMWNSWFVRQGFVVLSLDKRGVGGSTGNWRRSSMDDLASDWLAGIAMLAHRPDVDPKRVGVHGSSQGGWTAPIMASRSKDVAFLIVRAGSGMNVGETMAWENMWAAREGGLPAAQADELRAFTRQIFGLAARNAPWEEVEPLITAAMAKPWGKDAWATEFTKENWSANWSRLNVAYDSTDALRSVTCPVLWFFGDLDRNVPTAESAPRVAAALAAAGNTDVTIKTLANSAHAFIETKTGASSDFATGTRFVPGYWDTMESWLSARFGSKR